MKKKKGSTEKIDNHKAKIPPYLLEPLKKLALTNIRT